MEPLEIKLSKMVIARLKKTLMELKEASVVEGHEEPNLHIFVVKQTFLTGHVPKMSFAWTKTRPNANKMLAAQRSPLYGKNKEA